MNLLSPSQIVAELNKYIVGQEKAKRAVAIALRNRWRRMHVPHALRAEIYPKNILMIGPTGVGKTEIARRLAKLADAPFIKVEATKFTEVGYVGRDVDAIIRDLTELAVKQCREADLERVRPLAQQAAENRVLDILLPAARDGVLEAETESGSEQSESRTRQIFRQRLRDGLLDDREIDISLMQNAHHIELMTPPGMEDMAEQLRGMLAGISSGRTKTRKLKVKDALHLVNEEEANKLLNEEDLKLRAVQAVEQQGIVFIDEIDKIAARQHTSGADVSRQGVQRDLLPLVEGTTVSTKYGMVRTDHILFIASGAFHVSKPSDLIPELQGRFPIRVGLESLSSDDFVQILTSTDAALTKQYEALLATEQVTVKFTEAGILRVAEIAFSVNKKTENIGARRLYTVMEKLLEELSFEAELHQGQTVSIDAEYVNSRLAELAKDEDLARYVL